jgi:hypothetical protein
LLLLFSDLNVVKDIACFRYHSPVSLEMCVLFKQSEIAAVLLAKSHKIEIREVNYSQRERSEAVQVRDTPTMFSSANIATNLITHLS